LRRGTGKTKLRQLSYGARRGNRERVAALIRQLLLLDFVLGCTVSAFASGRFTARLIADGAVSFAFLPLIEIGAFALVYRAARPAVTFGVAAPRFLAGNAAWLAWLAAFAAATAMIPPRAIGPLASRLLATAIAPAIWSMRVDYEFFREVLHRSARDAIRDAVMFRAIAWTSAAAYFLGIAIWSELLAGLSG
jgi:hypothetical protein